ncbi:hypothetical protein AVEN_239503-1 [Araneus ventricosus]|uniref:Uncharacterized protein n=1 Tax=Araneus ventricosus TaxID=182803 RepID=A0A4Y2IJN7_ARAVE|nr:hypothetical protein AVEN_239503-1 [Araneus ventricosus]
MRHNIFYKALSSKKDNNKIFATKVKHLISILLTLRHSWKLLSRVLLSVANDLPLRIPRRRGGEIREHQRSCRFLALLQRTSEEGGQILCIFNALLSSKNVLLVILSPFVDKHRIPMRPRIRNPNQCTK